MPQNPCDAKALLDRAIDKHPLIMPLDAPLVEAIAAMSQATSSCALIVDQQRLVGILTERDVLRMSASRMSLERVTLSQVMTQPLITLPLAQAHNIFDLLALLRTSGIRHLPILDERGSVFGVITESTLLQALDFREMYASVELLQQTITDKTQELEASNRELQHTLNELKATQEGLIHSEKMAALGQLIAGVAHEINTPLGAIRASIGNISTAQEKSIRQLPQLLQQLTSQEQADFFALLNTAQQNSQPLSFREERQLRRALKKELEAQGIEEADTVAATLVSMGITQLGGGSQPSSLHSQDRSKLTPTSLISLLQSPNCSLILEAAYNLCVQHNNIQNMLLAVERATKIVLALKIYARQDNSGQMTKATVTEGIDVVLTLYHNQLKQGIEVSKQYRDVPSILCYPEELNQVWTNLLHNAIQAMNNRGKLKIAVFQQENHILVQFTDSGHGISPEIKSKIFEPFFTTKAAGEGSGLGLDIVRKIIDKHQGKIEVESEPGRTRFSVWLPIR